MNVDTSKVKLCVCRVEGVIGSFNVCFIGVCSQIVLLKVSGCIRICNIPYYFHYANSTFLPNITMMDSISRLIWHFLIFEKQLGNFIFVIIILLIKIANIL